MPSQNLNWNAASELRTPCTKIDKGSRTLSHSGYFIFLQETNKNELKLSKEGIFSPFSIYYKSATKSEIVRFFTVSKGFLEIGWLRPRNTQNDSL